MRKFSNASRTSVSTCPFAESLLLLRLRDGEGGARNFPLVTIENWHLHLPEQGNVVEIPEVGVVDFSRDVSFADGLLQCVLAVGGGHSLLCCPQVRSVLQGRRLKVVQVAFDRLVIECPGYVIIRVRSIRSPSSWRRSESPCTRASCAADTSVWN